MRLDLEMIDFPVLLPTELTLIPSRRDMALRGRRALKVRIVLKAGMLPNPIIPTNRLKSDT